MFDNGGGKDFLKSRLIGEFWSRYFLLFGSFALVLPKSSRLYFLEIILLISTIFNNNSIIIQD